MNRLRLLSSLLTAILLTFCLVRVEAQAPMKVIFDTDIGDDIDDAYALTLLATRPDIKLLGVTTAFGQTRERTEVAAKLLAAAGRKDVPVYAGRRGESAIREQYAWGKGYRSSSIKSEDAVIFLKREIDRAPGEVTLIAVGPLMNVADLFTKHPDTVSKLKRLVIMGGAVHSGYAPGSQPEPEWNIRCDPAAAKIVFTAPLKEPILMAGLEATSLMKFDLPYQRRLFGHGTPATDALAALTLLWGNGTPTLFDTVAVAHGLGVHYADEEKLHVVVDDNGLTRATEGTPNAALLINPRKEAFLDWFVTAMTSTPRRDGGR